MNFYRLNNPIREYAWGSTGMMTLIKGIENPENKVMAEMWLGAHTSASSILSTDDGEIALDKFIEQDPVKALGQKTANKFNEKLPFLMKILAAETPLSIQAHPNKEQALEGFERENAEGLSLNSPLRNYRDANHKPETIMALSPFTALCGFRKVAEIFELIKLTVSTNMRSELELLKKKDISGFLQSMIGLDPIRKKLLLNEFRSAASSRLSMRHEAIPLSMELTYMFPGDVTALMPMMMNIVTIEPGMALNIPAGVLHTYISGLGIELMASSDNVVRGGLTQKAMDVKELLKIGIFEGKELLPYAPTPTASGINVYETNADEFSLTEIKPESGTPAVVSNTSSPQIFLCVEGDAEIKFEDGASCVLKSSESIYILGETGSYSVNGECRIFAASITE